MPKISKQSETEIATLLEQGLQQLRLDLSTEQKNKILNYLRLLMKWNSTYNLVATHDIKEILIAHVFDSLSIAHFVQGDNILDLGSGAGFPGVPLAIIFPTWQFTLLDSVGKKTHFLTQVKIELALHNVAVVKQRVERFVTRDCFDSIVTRAVTQVEAIAEKTRHLLCPHGKVFIMKGVIPTDELQGITNYEVQALTVPFLNKERHLIILRSE